MSNVKDNERARRCTVLFDKEIYREARALARKKGLKWYQYLNRLLARETGLDCPTYLKHITPKNE